MHRVILWFRNDLRVHDNVLLNWATRQPKTKHSEFLPVYCFDPRFFDKTLKAYSIKKSGVLRTKFQLESVAEFRKNLQGLGSGLFVAHDTPEVFIKKLMGPKGMRTTVVYQQEVCDEERRVENALKATLEDGQPPFSVDFVSLWGSTLHHIDDMPYDPVEYFPHIYGNFRKKGESVKVRELLPTPEKGSIPFIDVKKASQIEKDSLAYLPSVEKDFGFDKAELDAYAQRDKRGCYEFVGGEAAGLKRCQEYIAQRKAVAEYAETRNNLIGADYSSKLSPWLANGCLSVRQVYHETRKFENAVKRNESTGIFIDELYWRDFNRYWCMNHGNKVFSSYGIYDRTYYDWKTDPETVQRWRDGMTGIPIIDALMRELNFTGFMPNRGRMVVASYFAMDLKQDWRHGAHYFEERLIDHDVQSNYGGWSFSAGIGPGRVLVFNTLTQSAKFDPEGKYIRMWCPELSKVPNAYIHDPWNMPASIKKESGVSIVPYTAGMKAPKEKGDTYPLPIKCDKYTSAEAAKKMKRPDAKQKKLDGLVKK